MNNIKGLIGHYKCSRCNQNHCFSEKINSCAVKKFQCPHFDIILIRTYDHTFKLRVTFVCNLCHKLNSVELGVGRQSPQNTLITDDNYTNICCGNKVDLDVLLSEAFLESINDINYDFNIYRNFSSNNNNINNINRNYNNSNEFKSFNSKNIIEFNEKNIILNFMDEKTKKTYKIYTKDELILKNVLEDLSNQFPEINCSNKKFMVNGRNIYPDSTIRNCNINNNSIIIIK